MGSGAEGGGEEESEFLGGRFSLLQGLAGYSKIGEVRPNGK